MLLVVNTFNFFETKLQSGAGDNSLPESAPEGNLNKRRILF
jgi:hypothetical protein